MLADVEVATVLVAGNGNNHAAATALVWPGRRLCLAPERASSAAWRDSVVAHHHQPVVDGAAIRHLDRHPFSRFGCRVAADHRVSASDCVSGSRNSSSAGGLVRIGSSTVIATLSANGRFP